MPKKNNFSQYLFASFISISALAITACSTTEEVDVALSPINSFNYTAKVTIDSTKVAVYGRLKHASTLANKGARITNDDPISFTFSGEFKTTSMDNQLLNNDYYVEVIENETTDNTVEVIYTYNIEATENIDITALVNDRITETCWMLELACSEPKAYNP